MASEYERFVVRKPICDAECPGRTGGQSGPMTLLSSRQVPEAEMYVEFSWIKDIPDPAPLSDERKLDYDQILLHVGMDYRTPQVLGGTVEFVLGGQPIMLNTTSAIFIPRGTSYGPLAYKEFQHPHIQLSIVLGSGDPCGGLDPEGEDTGSGDTVSSGGSGGTVPENPHDFDYEQYVVRSPMREAGPDYVEGRQNPTMTFMSGTQVPGMSNYIEFGWIWDVPSMPIPKMRHDNFDELVLHLGNDPDAPEDLGATLQFGLGDELVEFDTTHCGYLPRSLEHGPIIWKEVRRPMIEFAMMIGASTWAEGWEGSFFEEPDSSSGDPE